MAPIWWAIRAANQASPGAYNNAVRHLRGSQQILADISLET